MGKLPPVEGAGKEGPEKPWGAEQGEPVFTTLELWWRQSVVDMRVGRGNS